MKLIKLASPNDNVPAPRPPRRSIVRILYDTIEAIGGDGATEQEIVEMLPAAITDAKDMLPFMDRARLRTNLMSQVYGGYFLYDPNANRFRIASLAYYNARREYIKTHDRTPRPFRQHPHTNAPVVRYVTNWFLLVGVSLFSFVLGLLLGIVVR